MDSNLVINLILDYGLSKNLLSEEDVIYVANKLLSIFKLNNFERVKGKEEKQEEVIDKIIALGIKQKIISGESITENDLFDTLVMDALMPRPSEVEKKFYEYYNVAPKKAMDYFYKLSLDSDYIRMDRINKNICYQAESEYGLLDITINLSKPEKDLKEIAAAANTKDSSYPKCLLCYENVGFEGNLTHPARQNHRVIKVDLGNEEYYMQYSPYVYYNEHMIVFSKIHRPMKIDKNTFGKLIEFIEKYPHYVMGSNAGLPIVGGSILSHDHFQGGCYEFPLFKARAIKEISFPKFKDVKAEYLSWPLDVIKLTSKNKNEIIALSDFIYNSWKEYSDEEHEIFAYTLDTPHNAITPIARIENGNYAMYLALRNNRTDKEHPEGIFHPDRSLHHIKKENIGLIEVMGLAILPGRLNEELKTIKLALLKNIDDNKVDEKHRVWFDYLKTKYQKINEKELEIIINNEVGLRFKKVLECCSVFRFGKKEENLDRFINYLNSD